MFFVLDSKSGPTCHVCGARYVHNWSLKRHLRMSHGVDAIKHRQSTSSRVEARPKVTAAVMSAAVMTTSNTPPCTYVLATENTVTPTVTVSSVTAALPTVSEMIPPSLLTTPSRVVDDETDPYLSCTLAATALVRGVTAVNTEDESRPIDESEEKREDKSMSIAEAEESDRSSRSSPAAQADPGYRGVTTETVTPDPQPATAMSDVPETRSASTRTRSAVMSEEEIVDHFSRYPHQNGAYHATTLYNAGRLSFEAATNLAAEMCRIKSMLTQYAANLIIRRSQVSDEPSLGDPDRFLRDQLYIQSGQKL